MPLQRKRGFYEAVIKRVLDIVCALLAIVIFGWLYLILALLVRIKMGKPVLFRQPRPGGRYHIDIESGTDEVRLGEKAPEDILAGWVREAEAFLPVRDRYGLYD